MFVYVQRDCTARSSKQKGIVLRRGTHTLTVKSKRTHEYAHRSDEHRFLRIANILGGIQLRVVDICIYIYILFVIDPSTYVSIYVGLRLCAKEDVCSQLGTCLPVPRRTRGASLHYVVLGGISFSI